MSTSNLPAGYSIASDSVIGSAEYLLRYDGAAWVGDKLPLTVTGKDSVAFDYGSDLAVLVQKDGTVVAHRFDPASMAWSAVALSNTDAALIDAAVSSNPEMRLAAMDLAEILVMPLPAAPTRMAVRAQALVGFEAERAVPRRNWVAGLFDGFALPRAVMAAATVVVAISGFMMGGGLGESFAQEKHAGIASTSQTTNEMSSFFTGDGI